MTKGFDQESLASDALETTSFSMIVCMSRLDKMHTDMGLCEKHLSKSFLFGKIFKLSIDIALLRIVCDYILRLQE